MYTPTDLANWLDENQGPDTPWAYNHTPMEPDRVTTITPISAPYTDELEGDLEIVALQVRTRSERNQAGEEQEPIYLIDQIILDPSLYPYESFSGKWVLSARRNGGPPIFLRVDQQHRSEFVCNYHWKVER